MMQSFLLYMVVVEFCFHVFCACLSSAEPSGTVFHEISQRRFRDNHVTFGINISSNTNYDETPTIATSLIAIIKSPDVIAPLHFDSAISDDVSINESPELIVARIPNDEFVYLPNISDDIIIESGSPDEAETQFKILRVGSDLTTVISKPNEISLSEEEYAANYNNYPYVIKDEKTYVIMCPSYDLRIMLRSEADWIKGEKFHFRCIEIETDSKFRELLRQIKRMTSSFPVRYANSPEFAILTLDSGLPGKFSLIDYRGEIKSSSTTIGGDPFGTSANPLNFLTDVNSSKGTLYNLNGMNRSDSERNIHCHVEAVNNIEWISSRLSDQGNRTTNQTWPIIC